MMMTWFLEVLWGASYDKRPGGEFRILLVSNIGTDDGI